MAAARMGLTKEQFDDMTSRELAIYARAYREKTEYEQERMQQGIYAAALLISRFVWARGHKPSYEELFGKAKQQEEMSDEDMFQMAQALNARLGGRDERKGDG